MFSFGKENHGQDEFSAELLQLFAKIASHADTGVNPERSEKLSKLKERATVKAWEALIATKH